MENNYDLDGRTEDVNPYASPRCDCNSNSSYVNPWVCIGAFSLGAGTGGVLISLVEYFCSFLN